MADKAIGDLTPATAVGTTDLFVLEQNSIAKSLTGNTLKNWLLELAEGHGGIASISYTAPVSPSLDGTILITYADDTTYSITLKNGRGISSITNTATSGLVKTYTITYNDGTTSTFNVTDGATGATGASAYVHIKYSSVQPTSDDDMHDTADKWAGFYSGTSSTAPVHYTSYTWYEIKGATGTAATVALGTVTTTQLPAGSSCTCSITSTGEGTAQTTLNFAFGLAKGQDGTGAGTVTSVAVAQATDDTSISITGDSTITTSGTVKLGHPDLTTARDTQAVYPFTVNTKGHITGTGSALTPATLGAIADPASKSNGQVLTYNSTTAAWEAKNPSGAVTSVNGYTGDVVLASSDVGAIADPATKSSGQYLTYDGSAWVAGDISLTKVWENSSTTSSFAGQTVNLSESDTYALYLIKFSAADTSKTSNNGMLYQFAIPDERCLLVANRAGLSSKVSSSRICRLTYNHTAIFNEAYSDGVTDSSLLIPCIIYGVRGVAIQ